MQPPYPSSNPASQPANYTTSNCMLCCAVLCCLFPAAATELTGLAITMADFEGAIAKVQPSVRREGFATTPDVTWDDVGSLIEVGAALRCAVLSAWHSIALSCREGGATL